MKTLLKFTARWLGLLALAGSGFLIESTHAQVSQTIGNLAPGESVTITYEVTINSPLTVAVTQISHQGTVSGLNFTTVNTDDPETATANDATITTLAQNFDFGDAPDPTYPTLLANNGARHFIPAGGATLYLGTVAPDFESDGQPNANATGDDLAGTADEDGVTLPATIIAGQNYSITVVVTGTGGQLNAWIDWNRDGDWNDANEQIATNLALSAGSHPLSLTAPSFGSGGASFARFRLSTQSGLGPTGQAPDGEVEDYAVTLHVNTPPVANPDTVTRAKGRTVKVLKTTLLANDTDADGPSPLSLTSVNSPSSNGATVRILDDWVVYEANAGDNNDSFTYNVTDGIATSSGTVSVVVAGATGVTLNIVSDTDTSGERRFVVAGIPGRSYRLQIATNVLGPWTDVSGANATGVATSAGEVLVKDVAPPVGPAVFYRAVEP